MTSRRRPPRRKHNSVPTEESGSSTTLLDNVEEMISSEDKEDAASEEVPATEGSEIVDLNEKEETSEVMVDFQSEEESMEFLKEKTVEAKREEPIKEEKTGKSSEEVRKEIADYEKEKSQAMGFDDYYQMAEFAMNLIDSLASNSLRIWAKDKSSEDYELPPHKIRNLSKQLALILVKHQAKFQIEIIFAFTVISMYSGPFMLAKRRKKERKEDGEVKSTAKYSAVKLPPQESFLKNEGGFPLSDMPDDKPKRKRSYKSRNPH